MSRLDPEGAPVPPASVADAAQLAAWLEEVPAWLDQVAAASEPFRWVKRLTPADVGSLDARDAVAAWAGGRRLGGPDALAVAAAAEDRLGELHPGIVARFRERVGTDVDVDELEALRVAAWDSTVDAAGPAAPREAAFAWVLAQQAAEAGSVDAGRASAVLRDVLASRAPEVVARFDTEVAAGGAPAPALLAGVDELAPPPRAPQPLEADALGHDRLLDWRRLPGEVDQTVVAALGGYEAWITQAPFADDEFYWAVSPQTDGGPPREPADPAASGWAYSLADAAAAAEQATIELACQPAMTPAEAEAYLAANPRFAARVAAHARELAQRLGIGTTEMQGAPPHAAATVPALGDDNKSIPYVGGTRAATEHSVVVQAMVDRLGAAGITTRADAEALGIDERDEVLGVAAWSGPEDAAWAEALSRMEDSRLDVAPRWPAAPAAAQLRTLILRGQDAAAVARDIGVEPEWVRGILTGAITEVDAPRARLLSEAVGLTVSEVFGPASGPQELEAAVPSVDAAAPAPELDVDL